MWEKIGGEGIWTEYENKDTGERSLKTHKPKVVKQWCDRKKHIFKIRDVGKRLAVCKECGQELNFIVGVHRVEKDRVYLK